MPYNSDSLNNSFSSLESNKNFVFLIVSLISDLRNKGYKGYFEADGGIDLHTISPCYEAGCRIFVMGNAIFNSSDIKETIRNTKFLLDSNLEKGLLRESESYGIKDDWMKIRKSVISQFSVVKEIWEQ
jgi:transketolase